jgi:hypothetical protein
VARIVKPNLEVVAQIIDHETQGDAHQWTAAKLYHDELSRGVTQRALAEVVGKSQSHVKLMNAVWRSYAGTEDRPPFAVAYRDAKVGGVMYTHDARSTKRSESMRRHAYLVSRRYGISGGEYWQLYQYQGGHCAICRRATGRTKRLAVDHNHKCKQGHEKAYGCPECVRGLLCGPCNKLLGWLRDDPAAFRRGADYLNYPPYQAMRRLDEAA